MNRGREHDVGAFGLDIDAGSQVHFIGNRLRGGEVIMLAFVWTATDRPHGVRQGTMGLFKGKQRDVAIVAWIDIKRGMERIRPVADIGGGGLVPARAPLCVY